jgi:hypothetical protein
MEELFIKNPNKIIYHLHHYQKISTAIKALALKRDALNYHLKTLKAQEVSKNLKVLFRSFEMQREERNL